MTVEHGPVPGESYVNIKGGWMNVKDLEAIFNENQKKNARIAELEAELAVLKNKSGGGEINMYGYKTHLDSEELQGIQDRYIAYINNESSPADFATTSVGDIVALITALVETKEYKGCTLKHVI